jgi:hypothetical protein
MRRLLAFVLSGVLFAGNAAALSPDTDKQQPTGQAVTQKDKSSGNRDSSRTPGKPAATFNPTEKIGADSAVSFPVDI